MNINKANQCQAASIKQKIAQHIENRNKIKNMYKDKGIQTLNKPEQLMSEMIDPQLEPSTSNNYKIMKKELKERGFVEFRFLGKGAQGLVLLAEKASTKMRYAIKGIQIRDNDGNIFEQNKKQVKKEIEILNKCQGSPYVVNLLDQFEGKQFYYLILNECQGTLNQIIQQTEEKKLNELSAIKYSKDIAEGLFYVHSQNCLVNDLKMDNILIDYNGNAVVSDFGMADNLKRQSEYCMNQYQGNVLYQAPECYDAKDFNIYQEEYKKLQIKVTPEPSQRSEAFSLGYIIYTMIQGFQNELIFKKHQPLQYDNNFSKFQYNKQLKYIIDGLTQFKPRDRLSIKEVLILLKGIISFEFQLDKMFVEVIQDDGQAQQYMNEIDKDIQFVECFYDTIYPIIKNEKQFLQSTIKGYEEQKIMINESYSQYNTSIYSEIEGMNGYLFQDLSSELYSMNYQNQNRKKAKLQENTGNLRDYDERSQMNRNIGKVDTKQLNQSKLNGIEIGEMKLYDMKLKEITVNDKPIGLVYNLKNKQPSRGRGGGFCYDCEYELF